MKKNERKGISLIVLIITIIVIIVLAGAVILTLADNNPISQATKATYLSDVKNFQTDLELFKTTQYADSMGLYDPKLLQADNESITYNGVVDTNRTVKDLIPSLGKSAKYNGQFQVINGELIFGGYNTNMQEWTREVGIEVVIIGEPQITIVPPSETVVEPGTDMVYTIKFSSNAALTTIDLTNKIEVLDNNGVALLTQPNITIGTITGTNVDAIRQVNIAIKTDSLTNGTYKVKIKSGVVTNANDISNTIDTISLIGFDILDVIPPENPIMSANPTIWTNGDVTVSITFTSDSLTKEYSFDTINWNNYTDSIVVSENNITVYARGKDLSGNESGVSTLTVSNIDKLAPAITATNGGSTTSSVTVTAVSSDIGGSGILASSYQYSKDNGTTWTTITNSTNYTFDTLTSGTYQCKVKVSDNAGNSSTSSAVGISTTSLSSVTLLSTPSTWTNGNVVVTITYPAEVVTKQYSTDALTWNTYVSGVSVTANNTTIYARGIDAGGNQTTQATITVTNIDKVLPTVTASNGGATSSSVTVTASASDIGGSGILASSYQYSKDNGATWTAASSSTSYTFNALTSGTYQCRVRVLDNTGNINTSSAVAIVTTTLSTITMISTPATLTNGNVVVTITYPAEVVTKQYSTNGTTWNTYVSGVTVSVKGTTVYARGTDAGGNQTAQATVTVNNINTAPTINVTSPTAGNTFTTSLSLQGTATDANIGEAITVKYNIDGGATQTVSGSIIANGSAQAFTTTSVNLTGLGSGAHTLNVWSEDSFAVKSPITSRAFTKQVLYSYTKYNSTLSTQYVDGPWVHSSNGDATGVSSGGSSYTFSPSIGYTTTGISGDSLRFDFYSSIYVGSGTTIYRYDRGSYLYAWPSNGWGNYSYTLYTKTASTGQVYVQGSLVQSGIQAVNGTYPDNGRHSDGYWYVKGGAI